MAYDPGAIDATLAAAVGDEPQLIAELRQAFAASARKSLEQLEAATDTFGWRGAAARLKGLAASFGAVRLMALSMEAETAEAGNAALLRKLRRAIERF